MHVIGLPKRVQPLPLPLILLKCLIPLNRLIPRSYLLMFTISLLTGLTCYLAWKNTKVLCSLVRNWFAMRTEILHQPVFDAGAKHCMPTLHDTQKRMAFGQAQNGTSRSANFTTYGSFNASALAVIGTHKIYRLC